MAEDASIAGVLKDVDADLKAFTQNRTTEAKPLLICSGGTSSRCAADGHWTLDLRDKYSNIEVDPIQEEVYVEGGVKMSSLLEKLAKYGKSFPTGLSGQTGIGYILTGGISPLSRSQGLAIDQIIELKGFWGSGEPFEISHPNSSSSINELIKWRGLCGAAPFLGIVTSLKLRIQDIKPFVVWQSILNPDQLIEAIKQSEEWLPSSCLQWIWGDKIFVKVVVEHKNNGSLIDLEKLEKTLPDSIPKKRSHLLGLQNLPSFYLQTKTEEFLPRCHSEVVGLLAKPWGGKINDIVQQIEGFLRVRPHPKCCIAAQQLGGLTNLRSRDSTSFIHRKSMWKPWITASWNAGHENGRFESLHWLETSWEGLEPNCLGVHLAQMHQHLPFHEKEIKSAFQEWLPKLKELKSSCDPQGILPNL